jgi:hypothetical protein
MGPVSPRAALVIKPVSAGSLGKMGVFANTAGDCRRFPRQRRRTGSSEARPNVGKARISGLFLVSREACGPSEWLAGAGGIEDGEIEDGELEIGCSRRPREV